MRHRGASTKEKNVYQDDRPCGRLLLALRAGPMDDEQISARFGWERGGNLPRCIRDGFVDFQAGYYRLTDAGKVACPSRRAVAMSVGQE